MAKTATSPSMSAALADGSPARPVARVRSTPARLAWSIIPPAALLIIVLGGWELLVRTEVVSPIIVAPPSDTFSALIDLVQSPTFPKNFFTTAAEAVIGGILGLLGGLLLGIASSLSPFLSRTLYPYIVFFQGLPKVVLAPVFVTWFGFGISSKIVMVIVLTFFPLYINTVLGLSTTDKNAMSLMRSYGASKKDIFFKLQLPSALPSIFAGVKTSASFALIGSIVAEFLGARNGLGYLMLQNNFQLRTDRVYALIVILAFMGLFVYLSVEYLYRKVVFWEDHGALR
ncbi:ABC transporter permease [Conexibacter sp. CPCC 206217]|uniref:ABC transporter permease n=1 Tax=Conexibacter sp. CPCC 206217 TaxID=3064574 RepID=UPI00271D8C8D|nr:ABC transporter permease [Conexibacter sp. CPCC 206217]MDO8211699.1 ABC transporter permease [Conexibacter sp. CPCC 206217]